MDDAKIIAARVALREALEMDEMDMCTAQQVLLDHYGAALYDVLCAMRGPDTPMRAGYSLCKRLTTAVVRWEVGARSHGGMVHSPSQARAEWEGVSAEERNNARQFFHEEGHWRVHVLDAATRLNAEGKPALSEFVELLLRPEWVETDDDAR